MTLPTKTNLETMDYSYGGVPFVSVATKAGIDLDTLDYSYAGVPFWGLEVSGGGTPSAGSVRILPMLCAIRLTDGAVSIAPVEGTVKL